MNVLPIKFNMQYMAWVLWLLLDQSTSRAHVAIRFSYLFTYNSPFHIVQITDFSEFRHGHCKEKAKTFTEFLASLVVTKNINKLRSACEI